MKNDSYNSQAQPDAIRRKPKLKAVIIESQGKHAEDKVDDNQRTEPSQKDLPLVTSFLLLLMQKNTNEHKLCEANNKLFVTYNVNSDIESQTLQTAE